MRYEGHIIGVISGYETAALIAHSKKLPTITVLVNRLPSPVRRGPGLRRRAVPVAPLERRGMMRDHHHHAPALTAEGQELHDNEHDENHHFYNPPCYGNCVPVKDLRRCPPSQTEL